MVAGPHAPIRRVAGLPVAIAGGQKSEHSGRRIKTAKAVNVGSRMFGSSNVASTVRLLGRRQTFPASAAKFRGLWYHMLQRIQAAPCPSCHSEFVEWLEMIEPVVSGMFWRCNMCGHVWKDSDRAGDSPLIRPKPDRRRSLKADVERRRKTDAR